MDCIVAAGGVVEPDDPLFAYTQGRPKALIDMGGRTMLERVVDAVQSSRYVEEVIVVGLGSDMGMTFKRPVHHLPDHGGLVSNAVASVDWLVANRPADRPFLACTADVPLIRSEILDAYIESCAPFDHGIYYIMVSKETMEQRFPESRRTFVKLKGVQIAGGDVAVMQPYAILENRDLWEALVNARKHAWQIARAVGLRLMLKLLTKSLAVRDIETTAHRIIGHPVKVVMGEHAELAMDADKPHQVDLMRAEFARLAKE